MGGSERRGRRDGISHFRFEDGKMMGGKIIEQLCTPGRSPGPLSPSRVRPGHLPNTRPPFTPPLMTNMTLLTLRVGASKFSGWHLDFIPAEWKAESNSRNGSRTFLTRRAQPGTGRA